MRRARAVLALAALVWVACGKYGPPVRTRPEPPAAATANAEAAGAADPEEEEGEQSP